MDTIEVWLPIPEYETRYRVSDRGRVQVIGTDAIARRRYCGHFLTPTTRRGYPCVSLWLNRKVSQPGVHRLVAAAFIGPCPANHQVNHKNGDKADNRLENLEYVTASQNYRHALDVLGHKPVSGAKHWSAVMTDTQIVAIRERYASGETQQSIADSLGKNTGWICQVCTGRTRPSAGGPMSGYSHQR